MGLIGEFNEQNKAHHAIGTALAAASDGKVETTWVSTNDVSNSALAEFDGLWCVPGMPYRSADGALAAIKYARSHRIPFLGTSAGFQYALIEYARNVLGFVDAEPPSFPSIGANPHDKGRLAAACRNASADDVAEGLCSTVPMPDRGSRA